MNIHHHQDLAAVAEAVAERIIQAASLAIAERGVFHWALAGGTSPRHCYALLRHAEMDWSKIEVWFGDERCLPIGDPERNDTMADSALLSHVAIPATQVHRIAAEQGAELAAAAYSCALSKIPCLDLVLLGMGEDGHTASLFPGNPALDNPCLAVPVFHSPKAPSERVSMGYSALHAARQRIIMVTGEGKRDAFARVQQGEALPVRIPNSAWYSSI